MPTVHSLVALDDNPPMVVNLADVEIASMERIQFGLKSFDLVFVWKDCECCCWIKAWAAGVERDNLCAGHSLDLFILFLFV